MALWWLDQWNVGAHDQSYELSKVRSITIVASRHKVINQWSNIEIRNFSLEKKDWRYLYLLAFISLIIWSGFARWLFTIYIEQLKETIRTRIDSGKPITSYQKLTLESHRDKEKSAILQFLASEYSNPDINLELLTNGVGVNRNKVNEMLKDELGLTFSAYLNKLRSTEAARLLHEQPDATISEIAFSVGYKSVAHFNKVFKTEYGCTPKQFKVHRDSL